MEEERRRLHFLAFGQQEGEERAKAAARRPDLLLNNGSYTTGTGNQFTGDGTWTYSYDAEGNMTKKSQGASAETWTYGYDQRNQLIWAEKRAEDDQQSQLLTRADYKYGPSQKICNICY